MSVLGLERGWMFFDGFGPDETIDVALVGRFRFRRAGTGPTVLLLHGHPQTHAMWHDVASRLLASGYGVLCPDLPGYGGTLPSAREGAEAGTKSAMARDLLGLLDTLGLNRISIAGHDRGGRVAEQISLDAPSRVARLALIDVVPTIEPIGRADMAFSLAAYRMFWFAQKHPKPESLIRSAPSAWFGGKLPGEDDPSLERMFHPDAIRDYVASGVDPDTLGRINEAYRRATELDAVADRIARAEGRRITCPTTILWGSRGVLGGWYDPVALWREHASGPVTGHAIEAGHFTVEENPADVADRLTTFFAGDVSR